MPSIASLTAALAFVGIAVAAPPAPPPGPHKCMAFSVKQRLRFAFAKNGPMDKVQTLRKYNKVVPAKVLFAASAGPSATMAASAIGSAAAIPSDLYDSSYLSPVTIGNTTLQLDFDTGSADLWVFSSLQPSNQRISGDYYKVNASKKISGASWKIEYGDGSGAAGYVYADKVIVGAVTATTQDVEAATSVSSSFVSNSDTDGLLGLAFSSINTVKPTQAKTWFDTVHSMLALPVFSLALKYHAAGSYDFGFIDKAKYTGSITYVNVITTHGYWEFNSTGYAIGTGAITKISIDAIADSGTSLIYLPTSVVKAYYAKVTKSSNSATYGGYVFPCSATLPSFSAVIGGVKQVVPGTYIKYGPVTTGSSTCYGGIQDNSGIGFSIFGDIFLKSKYVIHELSSTPRIGFAQQAGVTA